MQPKAAAPIATSGRTKGGGYYNLNLSGPLLDPGMDMTPLAMPSEGMTDPATASRWATYDPVDDLPADEQFAVVLASQRQAASGETPAFDPKNRYLLASNDSLAAQRQLEMLALMRARGFEPASPAYKDFGQSSSDTVKSENAFQIIAKELPGWAAGSETKDLRAGLDWAADLMTIPFKALRFPVDVKDYAQVLYQSSNGNYTEATIKLTEVLIGKGTVKLLEDTIKNDMVVNGAGVFASKIGGEALEEK